MTSRFQIQLASAVAWLVAIPLACATGKADFDDTGGSTTSTGSGQGGGVGGGNVGAGGVGGSAGSGGTSPCAIDCNAIQTPACQVAQCNAQTGQCEVVDDTDGAACDDGVFCTVDDACLAGVCEGGPQNDCGLQPGECEQVDCNESSQSCSASSLPNGAACTPSDLCQVNATCTNGLCIGTPKDCFFAPVPDDCHVSQCNPQNGQCEPVPGNAGLDCVDTNELCTVGKTCDTGGNCVGGSPKDCSSLTQGCFDGVCDTQTGQCVADPIPPGQQCAAATDACNQGLCDTNGNCVPNPINEGQTCDDGLSCTSGTTCQQGICGGGQSSVTVLLAEDFGDNVAGWQLDGEWQIGGTQVSSGESYGNPDPGTDHTQANQDNGVAGVVLGGNAATVVHPYDYLTSPVVDTTSIPTVYLELWRWLNSDYTPYMQNQVQVYDGVQWVTLWESGSSPGVQDSAWTKVTFDLTVYSNANLRVRFGFQIGSSGVYTVSQWNVDDVLIASGPCN